MTIPLLMEEEKNGATIDETSAVLNDENAVEQPTEVTPKAPPMPPPQGPHVSLLSLLSSILSDPNTDTKERGAALEILSVITMHDPNLVRKYCLDTAASAQQDANGATVVAKLHPNDLQEVLFATCPPEDLMLALIFTMTNESDAGCLLQTSDIIRYVLEMELVGGEHTNATNGQGDSLSAGGGFQDEENNVNACNVATNNGNLNTNGDGATGGIMEGVQSDRNSFLALFYDRYVQWLVAPFQYKVMVPRLAIPQNNEAMGRIRQEFCQRCTAGISDGDHCIFEPIHPCSVRASFTFEIISFSIRAHVHRMKFFMLRTRLLGAILKMTRRKDNEGSTPSSASPSLQQPPWALQPGSQCLKLASLKVLRSMLSIKDEFYHRHIVQYNLFAPVFEMFRENTRLSVGNNLISSAILEMCDFICFEKIKSLIDYIVTKHLSKTNNPKDRSLEDIANPHVETFKQIRKVFEDNNTKSEQAGAGESFHSGSGDASINGSHDGLLVNGRGRSILGKKALEDQRKFRQADEDDSYFNDDDDDDDDTEVAGPPAPPEQKLSTSDDMASLMDDVKSLDQ